MRCWIRRRAQNEARTKQVSENEDKQHSECWRRTRRCRTGQKNEWNGQASWDRPMLERIGDSDGERKRWYGYSLQLIGVAVPLSASALRAVSGRGRCLTLTFFQGDSSLPGNRVETGSERVLGRRRRWSALTHPPIKCLSGRLVLKWRQAKLPAAPRNVTAAISSQVSDYNFGTVSGCAALSMYIWIGPNFPLALVFLLFCGGCAPRLHDSSTSCS